MLGLVGVVASIILIAVLLGGCSDRLDEARRLEVSGDRQGAIEIYRDVLASDPSNLDALQGLAVDLMLSGAFDQALPVQERLVGLDRSDAPTRVELGFNYLNHQGRPKDAVRVLRAAAEIDPSPKHQTFLAQALIEAGAIEEAEKLLVEVTQTDPEYSYAARILASCRATTAGAAAGQGS